MLNEADPTAPESGDPPELSGAEEGVVNGMGPLIDTELERIDRRHAQLTRISTELVDALNLYHQLMHEHPGGQFPGYPGAGGYQHQVPAAAPMMHHPPQPQVYIITEFIGYSDNENHSK